MILEKIEVTFLTPYQHIHLLYRVYVQIDKNIPIAIKSNLTPQNNQENKNKREEKNCNFIAEYIHIKSKCMSSDLTYGGQFLGKTDKRVGIKKRLMVHQK